MATGQDVQQVAAGSVTRIQDAITKLRARTEDQVIESIAKHLEAVASDLGNAAKVELEKIETAAKQLLGPQTGRTSSAAPNQANAPKAAAPTKSEEKSTEQPKESLSEKIKDAVAEVGNAAGEAFASR